MLAFDQVWGLDEGFNKPFIAWQSAGKEELQIRLIEPGPDDSLVCVGYLFNRNGSQAAHVFRLNRKGELDPGFRPYTMPGQHPQGPFLRPTMFAPATDGGWLVSFWRVPGTDQSLPTPGLVRLRPNGDVDEAFQKALGTGLANLHNTEGSLEMVASMADGSLILAGKFDSLDGKPVQSPLRLNVDGKPDPTFSTTLATALPPEKPIANANTSPYVPSGRNEYYLACSDPSARTTTFMYVQMADLWGHQPSCLVNYGGDVASPGGAWQDCDARVREALANGAKYTERKDNPLKLR